MEFVFGYAGVGARRNYVLLVDMDDRRGHALREGFNGL